MTTQELELYERLLDALEGIRVELEKQNLISLEQHNQKMLNDLVAASLVNDDSISETHLHNQALRLAPRPLESP